MARLARGSSLIEVTIASAIVAIGLVFFFTSYHYFSSGQSARSSFDSGLQFTGNARSEILSDVMVYLNFAQMYSCWFCPSTPLFPGGSLALAGDAGNPSTPHLSGTLVTSQNANNILQSAPQELQGQVNTVVQRCLAGGAAPSTDCSYFMNKAGVYFCLWITGTSPQTQNNILASQPLIGEFYYTTIDQISGQEVVCPAPLGQANPNHSYMGELYSTLHWISAVGPKSLYRSKNGFLTMGYL